MITVRRTYPEIANYSTVSKPCCECGKKITRTLKAYQTQNPFNPKTSSEIREQNYIDLEKSEKEFHAKAESCSVCRNKKIPDVEVDLIETIEIQEAVSTIIEEYNELSKKLAEMKLWLSQEFEGKFIKGVDGRIGKIYNVYLDTSHYYGTTKDIVVLYDILRKDKKGLTQKTGHLKLAILEEVVVDG